MSESLITQLTSLVFPIHCLSCEKEGDWLCGECLSLFSTNSKLRCAICAKAAKNGICNICQEKTKIDGIVSLFSYKGDGPKRLIRSMKYGGKTDIAAFIAKKFSRKILRQLPENFVATFVPADPKRLGERGFNQSELLAGKISGESVAVFRKIRSSPAQASLSKADRQRNLRKAFSMKISTAPETMVIFDDVITTGSTISELAKIAKRKGTREVWAAVIAHD